MGVHDDGTGGFQRFAADRKNLGEERRYPRKHSDRQFPAIEATGSFKDGEMLVLTISHEAGMRENGAPIWAVVSLTRDGDTLKTAQMLEKSQTIKRGVGKKPQD